MINYNSSDVVQCLRQYDMFANSLRLIKKDIERSMIIKQLSKLEEKILSLTNDAYLEEYEALAKKECSLLGDEKKRLVDLIELINQRLSYVEKRCNSHYQLTGESIDVFSVEGADKIDELEEKVRIIDKYLKNIQMKKDLEEDVKGLNNKIELANEKMHINDSLNEELEATFKKTMTDAFNKLNLYDLDNQREEIEYAYYETEKSLNLARSNYEMARGTNPNMLEDCRKMLEEVSADYDKYRDKISILKLIDIVSVEANDYETLANKRKEVNEILKHVKNEEFLGLVVGLINKQFSTIMMEEQDINTLNDLILERDKNLSVLAQIDAENNSDKFQEVLGVLIANEKKRQEKILEEQRRIEELEKQRKLELEREKQEEILKRQRIIEEARKKEIEKRTKQMLEEQQNSILQVKKKDDKKEKVVSFETIKDDTEMEENNNAMQFDDSQELTEDEDKLDFGFSLDSLKIDDGLDEEEYSRVKNKGTLEKELFDEFNNYSEKQEEKVEMPKEEKETVSDNKLPKGSFDDYMKNFSMDSVDTEDLFDEAGFPSIPM